MRKLFTLALAAIPLAALADESAIHLKDAPGKEVVEGTCAVCHSNDMIQMNSPFLDRKGWEAEVVKMVRVMGAPLAEEQIPIAVDYLTRNYGAEATPPAAKPAAPKSR